MILNNVSKVAIRVSDIRSIGKEVYESDTCNPRYYLVFTYDNNTYNYGYGDKDARDKDFERINRAMDAIDGIQQQ